MYIIPAIDLRDGKCVRLYQGKAETQTIYSEEPAEVARKWVSEGATYLHIVDLDGAMAGSMKNMDAVRAITKAVHVPVQLGGGIRDAETVANVLHAGISRVIIGTRACDLDFLRSLVAQFGGKIVVGIDAKDGMVSVQGWKEVTSIKALHLAKRVEEAGVKTIIYTDVARDGALKGPNIEAIEKMLDTIDINVIASGGVTTTGDVWSLCQLSDRGLAGMIIGKALYTGGIMLNEILEIAKKCSQKG